MRAVRELLAALRRPIDELCSRGLPNLAHPDGKERVLELAAQMADAAGALAFVPLMLLEAPTWRPWQAPLATGLALAALTVLCSIGAMALYTQGMRHLPTQTVAASINLMPVFGLAIAALVLRESVSVIKLLTGQSDPEAAEHPVGCPDVPLTPGAARTSRGEPVRLR